MENDANVVLCGANSYEQKYYLNEQFQNLPQSIQDELKILCVTYVEDVGGIFTMEFEPEGSLVLRVHSDEMDYLFDEIGSVLKVKQLRQEKRELLEALELFYRTFFLTGQKEEGREGQDEDRRL